MGLSVTHDHTIKLLEQNLRQFWFVPTNVFLDSAWERFRLAQGRVYSPWAARKQVKESNGPQHYLLIQV